MRQFPGIVLHARQKSSKKQTGVNLLFILTIFFIHILNWPGLKAVRAAPKATWPLLHKCIPPLHLDDLVSRWKVSNRWFWQFTPEHKMHTSAKFKGRITAGGKQSHYRRQGFTRRPVIITSWQIPLGHICSSSHDSYILASRSGNLIYGCSFFLLRTPSNNMYLLTDSAWV